MMRNRLLLGILVMLLAVGCRPTAQLPGVDVPTNNGSESHEKAHVESVEVALLESFPLQARAVLKGTLPDGCTKIDEITASREEMVFTIKITTQQSAEALCTEAEVPFEETVALDILDLEAGTYTVDAYSRTATFEMTVKNSFVDG